MQTLPLRVLKFGGTSVGDGRQIRRVIEIVRSASAESRVVVVVSAQAGVTDELIGLARRAPTESVDAGPLRQRLEAVSHELEISSDVIEDDFHELETLLRGIRMVGELTPRSLDRMMSYGERCSARIVASALQASGIPSKAVVSYDVGLLTDSNFGAARVLQGTYDRIPPLLFPILMEGFLPVITGFIAKDEDGVVTTLGRGGSDYSAAIFGAALGASEIQIWTDVDGIMTADPRIVSDARSLERMSFGEASELAYYGAKVIHPSTIQPAMWKEIPIRVLNTNRPALPGTTVIRETPESRPGVRSIASKAHITAIHVTSTDMLLQHGFMFRLFEVFEEFGVVIDMIATSEVSVTVTTDKGSRLLGSALAALRAFSDVKTIEDQAIVCLVGDRLREQRDLFQRLFSALASADIQPQVVSVGMSGRNVSLLVNRSDEKCAVQSLHRAFFNGDVSR